MPKENLLLDTSYIFALLNDRDGLHQVARDLLPRFRQATIWVTEAVLIEVGNSVSKLGSYYREEAVKFIEYCKSKENINVVNVTTDLFDKALDLYKRRPDKTSGLVDCISFVVMEEIGITAALTYDLDFVRARFTALMRGLVASF